MRLSQYYSRVVFDGRRGRPTIRASHVDFRRTIYRAASSDPAGESEGGTVRCQAAERPAD